MARDVNRYESVLLNKMVGFALANRYLTVDNEAVRERERQILLLLDCIVDFRNPPESVAVEDGCGAMVDKGASK